MDEVIPLMRLTSRVLARSGRAVAVLEGSTASGTNGDSAEAFDWDETVSIKQQIVDNWDKLDGEDILSRLDYLWTTQDTGVPRTDLRLNLDLWLLKALAQEKCLYPDLGKIEDTYHQCRWLGNWNSILVRNNLAVLKARRDECLESLSLLAEAIQRALLHKVPVRAPFFNAALLFHHLHQHGTLFEPKYLDLLEKVSKSLRTHGQPDDVSNETIDSETPADAAEPTETSNRTVNEITAAYRAIAAFGIGLKEPEPRNVFQESIAYLSPSLDLFESFGDSTNKTDARAAHQFFEQGNEYAKHEMFVEGIKSFALGAHFDPTRAAEAKSRSEQLRDEWRHERNLLMSDALEKAEFDEALSIVRDLPLQLRGVNDDELISLITQLRRNRDFEDDKAAARQNDHEKAGAGFIKLLRELDPEDPLRLEVSNELAEPLRALTNDAQRHEELNDLKQFGLHPDTVGLLADEFEADLVSQALILIQQKRFGHAIEKYFWACLLPARGQRRDALMRAALFPLGLFLKDNPDINACQPISAPIFSELKQELQARWDNDRSLALTSKFEKLDSETWLSRKEIDELIRLLEELINYEPTTERLVAKLRLPREKEAQQHFQKICAELETISRKPDHTQRREAIFVELSALRALALDLAAGEHQVYAQQITDFVLKTEAYLLQSDNQRFKHEMTFEANRRREEEFQQFRNTLRESEPVQVLNNIANGMRKLQGTHLLQQAVDVSVHWLKQDCQAIYRGLLVDQPEQARPIIRDSLEIIRRYQSVLPTEFKVDLVTFLTDLANELEPAEARANPAPEPSPAEPASPSPPPPPPAPEGFWQKFKRWFTASK